MAGDQAILRNVAADGFRPNGKRTQAVTLMLAYSTTVADRRMNFGHCRQLTSLLQATLTLTLANDLDGQSRSDRNSCKVSFDSARHLSLIAITIIASQPIVLDSGSIVRHSRWNISAVIVATGHIRVSIDWALSARPEFVSQPYFFFLCQKSDTKLSV